MDILIVFIVFIVLIPVVAVVPLYVHRDLNFKEILYLGLRKCKYCNNLADFYLKENENRTRTVVECSKCYHQNTILPKQYINYKNIPSKQKCHLLAKQTIKELLKYKKEYLENSDKKDAMRQWENNNQKYLRELKEHIRQNDYNETYVLGLYESIYYKMAKGILY